MEIISRSRKSMIYLSIERTAWLQWSENAIFYTAIFVIEIEDQFDRETQQLMKNLNSIYQVTSHLCTKLVMGRVGCKTQRKEQSP